MSLIRRLHVPLRAPEDVIPHLGAARHWKEGRSAKSLVDQWWSANALPASVSVLLDQAEEWRGAELIDAIVERCTSLDDGRPSHPQSDMLAIVGLGDRLGVVAIEAKVDEGFDKTVDEWIAGGGPGKQARLAGLCKLLGLDASAVGGLRYQLFHRTVASVIEARRYRAAGAAMIVQSWSAGDHGLDDFRAFFAALGLADLEPGRLSARMDLAGVPFRTGWARELRQTG